ncbi:hypothetical protein HNY73_006935 [Argiope bruennichi]|uniref:Uncharacterized protein n=1 Tax=Argiope bruennichi TaxID=94029 RepID=A0A8T0FHI2_ARGBR|nr:hypothetical protein HNY73_006935 [Argiope bruennichi]
MTDAKKSIDGGVCVNYTSPAIDASHAPIPNNPKYTPTRNEAQEQEDRKMQEGKNLFILIFSLSLSSLGHVSLEIWHGANNSAFTHIARAESEWEGGIGNLRAFGCPPIPNVPR